MSTFNDLFNSRLKAQKLKTFSSDDFVMQSYFTGYLNMARQNCCIVLSHISQSFGFKTGAIIDTALSKAPLLGPDGLLSKKKEVGEMIKMKLLAAFPVLDPMIRYAKKSHEQKSKMDDYDKIVITAEDVARMLVLILDVLSYYRDMSSHVVFNDDRTASADFAAKEQEVADALNHSVTVALRVVKDRFSLETEHLDFYNKNRYRASGRGRDREVRLNTSFAHSLRTEDRRLSLIGLVYLACQLMEKQYATMFFDLLGDRFYGIAADKAAKTQEQKRMILREMFSVYRVRIPKERMDSTRGDTALALDILNELGKCPDELFERIRRSDQKKFELTDKDGNRVLLRRNADRFPVLALKYLDETRKFNELRFHVTFGKYRWLFRDAKKCADGIQRQRWLQKELNGFGRLQEVERKRIGMDDGWNGTEFIRKFEDVVSDDAQEGAYVTDFRTQYLFNRDKIGISFQESMPQLELVDGQPVTHKDVNGNMKVRMAREIPQAYLSVYEIPAMLFLTHLKSSGTLAESIVKNALGAYGRLFDDFGAGRWDNISEENIGAYSAGKGDAVFTLSWKNDVPRKIRDKVTGRKRRSFQTLAKTTLRDMLERTQRQLERFRDDRKSARDLKNNKQGKDRFVDIRAGRLANFLAKDITRLMPSTENGTNKPTGLNYCLLQKELATYGPNSGGPDNLIRIFQRAGVIGNASSHPFLHKVLTRDRPMSVLDLYERYLDERCRYLDGLLNGKSSLESVSFLKSGRLKYSVNDADYVARLAEKYRTRPIYLPTGLFTPAIRKELERRGLAMNEKANAAWLISEYFSQIEKDGPQSMYDMARNYRIFDLLEFRSEPGYLPLAERKGKANTYGLVKRTVFMDSLGAYYDRLVEDLNSKLKEEQSKERRSFDRIKAAKEAIAVAKEEKKIWEAERTRSRKSDNWRLDNEKYFCRLKSARNEFDDCERMLRRYQVQDIVLFIAAREILFAHLPKDMNLRLRGLNVWDEKGILSQPVVEFSMDVTWTEKDENGRKIHKTASIKEDNVVIKNYGRIFRLLYDDRVKTLLPQITLPMDDGDMHNARIVIKGDKVVIDKSLFDEDLSSYDRRRHEICEIILKFEEAAMKLDPKLFPATDAIDFNYVLTRMESSGRLTPADSAVLRAIRNAYNHNKYPSGSVDFAAMINSANMPKITESIYDRLNSLIRLN